MKSLLLLILLTSTIAYSQNSSSDSITYPRWGKDPNGIEVVTISKIQQITINTKLLKLTNLNDNQASYIRELEYQLGDYSLLQSTQDSITQGYSDILTNRLATIDELNTQLRIKDILIQQSEHNYKTTKKKLLGWKIGTYTTIGVILVAIPVTFIVLN